MVLDLRAERRRRGLSLRRMATEIGVSTRVLQAAELGHQPRPDNAKLIADYYGVDVVLQWPDSAQAAA